MNTSGRKFIEHHFHAKLPGYVEYPDDCHINFSYPGGLRTFIETKGDCNKRACKSSNYHQINDTMKNVIQFGEKVEGYNIPVLNEREIRASAGILFLGLIISLMEILYRSDFLPVKYFITIFLTDFAIRVFINPKFSPTLIIGRLAVRNQVPEYVGTAQKKVAWIIGLALSATMFIFMVIVNSYSPITGIICLICLIFTFFESVFGICLGCKFYKMIYQDKAQYCPGEVCDVKSKQDIQKISGPQLLIVLGFIVFISLTAFFFNDFYSKTPYDLFGINSTTKSK